jgi:hypothetical protein
MITVTTVRPTPQSTVPTFVMQLKKVGRPSDNRRYNFDDFLQQAQTYHCDIPARPAPDEN